MAKRGLSGDKEAGPGRGTGHRAAARPPRVDLTQALGNRMVSRLLGQERVQAKGIEPRPGDALEQEADRAAETVAPAGNVAASASSAEPAPAAATPASAPEAAAEAAPALLADDEAERTAPGQMRKSEFLAELRKTVCATAEEGLATGGQTAQGCPWIEYWLNYYGGQEAGHVERAIRKFAPEAAAITSAREYIPVVAARVRRAVDAYTRTGEAPEMPAGMPGGGLGAVGSIFFKARDGGSRAADPQAIRGRLGAGEPLESGVRSQMESAFGSGFSRVRVHTDSRAASLSNDLNARAFTVGEHVAFSPGEYQPGSAAGQALIAHELAHVVQQGASLENTQPSAGLEEDADRSAVGAVASILRGAGKGFGDIAGNALPRLRSGLGLQRCGRHDPVPKAEPEIGAGAAALGQHAVDLMKQANSRTTKTKNTGIYYDFEYKATYPDAWDDDYRHGYANPDYWERLGGNWNWRLKKGRSASAAVKAWLSGLTIAECYSTAIVIEVDTLRAAIGDAKFDERFGSEDKDVGERLVLGQQGSNALGSGMLESIPVPGGLGTIGHRPAKVGEWYYFYNHPQYLLKHPAGVFQGENALLREDTAPSGDQLWEGLGEPKTTERRMLQDMVHAYNNERTRWDEERLADYRRANHGVPPPQYERAGSVFPWQINDENDVVNAPPYTLKDPLDGSETTRKGGFVPEAGKRLSESKVQQMRDAP